MDPDTTAVSRRNALKAFAGVPMYASVAGCIGGTESDEFSFQLNTAPRQLNEDAIEVASQYLEEETDGRINLSSVAPGNPFPERMDDIDIGNVDGGVIDYNIFPVVLEFTEYGFLGSLFLYDDWEHLDSVQQEYVFSDDGLAEDVSSETNTRLMANMYGGPRGITANKPITHPDDVQDMDLRLPGVSTWVQISEEIGFNPTTVSTEELYSALQTGVVEASEGPINQFVSYSLGEVQSYFTFTDHQHQMFSWVLNQDSWESLSDNDQVLVQEAFERGADWGSDEVIDREEEFIEEAIDMWDTEIIGRDEVEYDAFVDRAMPAIEELFEEEWTIVDLQEI